MQRSLVLLKPDAYERSLMGEIMGRLERKGFKIVDMKFYKRAPRELIEKHYEQYRERDTFSQNCDYMTRSPLTAIVYEGEGAIQCIRALQGNGMMPGSIRGDYVTDYMENLIHASDSTMSAEKEIALWFPNIEC